MPNKLQKSLKDYLSKIKNQTPNFQFSHGSFSSTTSKILSGCKHPKSSSFVGDRKGEKDTNHDHDHQKNSDTAATLEDIDKFLFENFKSLYGQNHDIDNDRFGVTREDREEKIKGYYNHRGVQDGSSTPGRGSLFDSPRYFTHHPDLCGSQRFFVSSGSSSSLFEEPTRQTLGGPVGPYASDDMGSTSASPRAHDHGSPAIPKGVEDCIAVLTVSPSPFEEFRRSMSEVVEARIHHNQRVDWDFLEELLFCFLRLNEKKQYRYILSAFVDLIATLRQISSNREVEELDREDKYSVNYKGKGRRDF